MMLVTMCNPTAARRKCLFITWMICCVFLDTLLYIIMLTSGTIAIWECETNRKDYSDGCKASVNAVSPMIYLSFFAWHVYFATVLYHYMKSTDIIMTCCCGRYDEGSVKPQTTQAPNNPEMLALQ